MRALEGATPGVCADHPARALAGAAGAGARSARCRRGWAPGRYARRVTVQVHVQRMTRYGAQAASKHLAYIEREGTGRDGPAAVLWRTGRPGASASASPRSAFGPARRTNSGVHGVAGRRRERVDLEDQRAAADGTIRARASVGPSSGRRAITTTPRGRTRTSWCAGWILEGSPGCSCRASTSRTACAGRRRTWRPSFGPAEREREIQQTREREVTGERLTSLDRELARWRDRRAPDGAGPRIDAQAVRQQSRNGIEAQHLFGRLEHLERLAVAVRVSPSSWQLAPDWEKHLRDSQRAG